MPAPTPITNAMLNDANAFMSVHSHNDKHPLYYSKNGCGIWAEVIGAVWYAINDAPAMYAQLRFLDKSRKDIPVSEFENEYEAVK